MLASRKVSTVSCEMKPQPLDVSWCKQHVTDISQRAKGQRLQHNYITLQQEHTAAALACVILSGPGALPLSHHGNIH